MKILCSLFICFTFIYTTLAGRQSLTISGKVSYADSHAPLAEVNIRIAGISCGTITNSNGQYELPVERGPQTIIFSSLAYV